MENSFLFRPFVEIHSCRPIKQKEASQRLLNKLFTFTVNIRSSSEYSWQITRTYQEFVELSQNLHSDLARGLVLSVPHLPSDTEFKNSTSENQLKLLCEYLHELGEQRDICDNSSLLEFFEVSVLSFSDTIKKRKEGYVNKRTGGRVGNEQKCFNCTKHCKRLQRRWLIVRDNMVGYLSNHLKGSLHEVLMFKGKFEVLKGVKDTGYNDGILIITQNRKFCFRAGSEFKMEEWYNEIQAAKNESEWANKDYFYESSFPVRPNNQVRYFVDGIYYFNEVCENLLRAKREVFITDWWLSPEMYLKRPTNRFKNSQVFEVLGTIADRGVLVYVHIYKEVSFALTLNSLHTKNMLQKRNPNIKVVRHPHRSVRGGEFLWTHHEKIVCIDQEIAFIGGLDLCYGRMDTSEHRLKDNIEPYHWPGIDYSNGRIADFQDVRKHETDTLNRNEQPRMPWHDIAMQAIGKVASDIALHFIELWNHVMTDITGNYHKDKIILKPLSSRIDHFKTKSWIEDDSLLDKSLSGRRNASFMSKPSIRKVVTRTGSESKRINIALLNQRVDEEPELITDDKAIHVQEMPEKLRRVYKNTSVGDYSDISVSSERDPFGKRKSLTQRPAVSNWMNREKMEAEEEDKMKSELEADIIEGDEAWARNLLMPKLKELGQTGSCECQVVRSSGTWSLGLDTTEHSIHTAYLHLIDQADSFIYIENQFFVSSTAGELVKNSIAQAIVDRIKIAAQNKDKFKVVVVLPLLPGFAGSVEDNSASVLRIQLHWLYATISRSENSVYNQLLSCPYVSDPAEYISFYGLRTHDMFDKPVTEIVYVHSKLMIIDDDTVILGSANINDRSQLGYRDSEIAMVIRDNDKIDSMLAGAPRKVSRKALELRKQIFKEIMGISDENILQDPVSDVFNNYLKSTARVNTRIYKEVFRCVPDNEVQRFKDIPEFVDQAKLEDYHKKKNGIRGFVVEFPLHFLHDEDLRITIFNKEYYIPEESFI